MPRLARLSIKNFRSVEEADIRLGPITVLYGPTSAGKSSLLYSLMALRNFVVNPSGTVDGLFNLGFQSLGGFAECVFNHASSKTIDIGAFFEDDSGDRGSYSLRLRKSDVEITTGFGTFNITAPNIALPYGVNQTWAESITEGSDEFNVNWNGIASTVSPKVATSESQAMAVLIAERINSPAESLKRIDVCPHRRGFFKPFYTPAATSTTPTNEDEVATIILNDPYSAGRISADTQEIFDRDFRLYTPSGTSTTSFQTSEVHGARIPTNLVNDGFGVNQIVYMLAKIYRPEVETILIEEPEIHLHPNVIRAFAQVVSRIATSDNKQFIFTTHSEQFLLALLATVKAKKLMPSQLACYKVGREGKRSVFTEQAVSEDGQIAGGFSSFLEGELEDLRTLLSVVGD